MSMSVLSFCQERNIRPSFYIAFTTQALLGAKYQALFLYSIYYTGFVRSEISGPLFIQHLLHRLCQERNIRPSFYIAFTTQALLGAKYQALFLYSIYYTGFVRSEISGPLFIQHLLHRLCQERNIRPSFYIAFTTQALLGAKYQALFLYSIYYTGFVRSEISGPLFIQHLLHRLCQERNIRPSFYIAFTTQALLGAKYQALFLYSIYYTGFVRSEISGPLFIQHLLHRLCQERNIRPSFYIAFTTQALLGAKYQALFLYSIYYTGFVRSEISGPLFIQHLLHRLCQERNIRPSFYIAFTTQALLGAKYQALFLYSIYYTGFVRSEISGPLFIQHLLHRLCQERNIRPSFYIAFTTQALLGAKYQALFLYSIYYTGFVRSEISGPLFIQHLLHRLCQERNIRPSFYIAFTTQALLVDKQFSNSIF